MLKVVLPWDIYKGQIVQVIVIVRETMAT